MKIAPLLIQGAGLPRCHPYFSLRTSGETLTGTSAVKRVIPSACNGTVPSAPTSCHRRFRTEAQGSIRPSRRRRFSPCPGSLKPRQKEYYSPSQPVTGVIIGQRAEDCQSRALPHLSGGLRGLLRRGRISVFASRARPSGMNLPTASDSQLSNCPTWSVYADLLRRLAPLRGRAYCAPCQSQPLQRVVRNTPPCGPL